MMPPKDEKLGCQSLSLDILSNLPKVVTDAILIRLPLRDAMRTSILSKKWRYTWCTLPELTLDLTHLSYKNDITFQFTYIVYHLLTLHAGPITKFTLCFSYPKTFPTIDSLIYFLYRNNIQHLVLELRSNNRYKLPSLIFKCEQLRHLTLECCLLIPPPSFKGFDRLISLELRSVTVSAKLLECLISNCSLLERLVLANLEISDVIEIKATMLRYFHCSGSIRYICLKHVPLLAKIYLLDDGTSVKIGKCNIAKLFEPLSAVEHLHLNCNSLKFFAAGEVPPRLPFYLNTVKSLHLSEINLEELDVVSCTLCLIRSFPYLQYLEIKVLNHLTLQAGSFVYDEKIAGLECLEVEGFSSVTFSCLREVKLEGVLVAKPGMQLMKLLLAKSTALLRMLIKHTIYGHLDPLKLSKVLRRTNHKLVVVNAFPRASPQAEVIVDIQYC